MQKPLMSREHDPARGRKVDRGRKVVAAGLESLDDGRPPGDAFGVMLAAAAQLQVSGDWNRLLLTDVWQSTYADPVGGIVGSALTSELQAKRPGRGGQTIATVKAWMAEASEIEVRLLLAGAAGRLACEGSATGSA